MGERESDNFARVTSCFYTFLLSHPMYYYSTHVFILFAFLSFFLSFLFVVCCFLFLTTGLRVMKRVRLRQAKVKMDGFLSGMAIGIWA